MPLESASVSPELVLSLSLPSLRALVATFGPIDGVRPNASAMAIARALFEGRAPAKLARAIRDVVARFGTEAGRRALVEAARARHDARAARFWEQPPADVAASLAIGLATERGSARRATERILALAGLRLERELAERSTYELLAEEPVAAATLGRAISKELGASVDEVWTHEARDGGVRVAVFTRMPVTTRLVREGDALVARVEVPVAVDLVHVHSGGMRVSLTLALQEQLPRYASALGLSIRPSFTLRPLHELTREALASLKLPARVERSTVVARKWRRPDGSRHEVRAFDALDPAHDGATARSGYVDRATVRVVVEGRTVDAFLELPHRLQIADGAYEGPVREVLSRLGILAPGVMPDDARSLMPPEHGDWRWRSVVGDAGFEALVAKKRLTRVTAAHVVTEEHRMHGAGYVVRDVAGEPGVEYALAEDRSLGARLVGKKERLAWRLDLAALEGAMRRDLGATRVVAPHALAVEGVLDLGLVTLASGRMRFVYAMATPPKGWEAALVRACGLGVTPVVLVPKGHAGPDGALTIELEIDEQFGVKGIGRALGKAAEALGVGNEVDEWRRWDEEVVVDAKGQRVWVMGVAIALSEKPYRFVEYLGRNVGRVATTAEIGGYVSSSEYPDVAARRTKQEVERQIRAGLVGAGVDAAIVERLIVVEGRKGYRLGVGVKVV
jgi:hypothetical protein